MQRASSGQCVPVTATSRQLVARRLEAARVLAGRPSLRVLATQTGMSYSHLVGVAGGREPLTASDCRDLSVVLRCPEAWLRHGWDYDST